MEQRQLSLAHVGLSERDRQAISSQIAQGFPLLKLSVQERLDLLFSEIERLAPETSLSRLIRPLNPTAVGLMLLEAARDVMPLVGLEIMAREVIALLQEVEDDRRGS